MKEMTEKAESFSSFFTESLRKEEARVFPANGSSLEEKSNMPASTTSQQQHKLRFEQTSLEEEEQNSTISVARRSQISNNNFDPTRRQSTSSNFRRKRNGTSLQRRFSSRRRRRTSRRQSVFTSTIIDDDLDEIAMSGPLTSSRSCLRCVPMRPHGLFVATLIVLCSVATLICSTVLLFKNYLAIQFAHHSALCAEREAAPRVSLN